MSDPVDVIESVRVLGEACARLAIDRYSRIDGGRAGPGLWGDPYLLGLVQGMITGQYLPHMGRALDERATGIMILTTLHNAGADEYAMALSIALVGTRDPTFMRGYDDSLVSSLIMTASLDKDRLAEPDVVAAIAMAPRLREALDVPAPLELDDDLAAGIAFLDIKVLRNANKST